MRISANTSRLVGCPSRRYWGDWLVGGLFLFSALRGQFQSFSAPKGGEASHFVLFATLVAFTVVLALPLILSLRAGAVTMLAFEVVVLSGYWFLFRDRVPAPVISLLIAPYCFLRASNSIGPPMLPIRRSRI